MTRAASITKLDCVVGDDTRLYQLFDASTSASLIRQGQKRSAKEKLDTLLLEGLDSGDSIPVNTQFWAELKREALAKLEARS